MTDRMLLRKIISGGQTGADQGALDAALAHGFPIGGWLPAGRLTEAGPLDERYRLEELPGADYRQRTERNVQDADGTLIVSHGPLTGGSLLTLLFARQHGRPCLHLDLCELDPPRALERLRAWLADHSIGVLNVAGPRASHDPRIHQATFRLIDALLAGLSADMAQDSASAGRPGERCLERGDNG